MPADRSARSDEPVTCLVCAGRTRFLYEKSDYDVFRCTSCGLGEVRPIPTAEELETFYASTYYDGSTGWGYSTEYGMLEHGLKKMYRRFLRRVEALYPNRRYRRVIDVGCAYGFFLDEVEEQWQPDELVAVDVTPEARERNVARGRTFHSGFFEQVDLPEGHFDFVFMGDAFEHVRDPLEVVRKFERILSPGGVVVVTTIDFGSWVARAFGRRWRLMTPPEHLHFWTRGSLQRVFHDRGFTGRVENYWLYYPKSYVHRTAREQFGIAPRFLDLLPGDIVPVPSFDVVIGIFEKKAA